VSVGFSARSSSLENFALITVAARESRPAIVPPSSGSRLAYPRARRENHAPGLALKPPPRLAEGAGGALLGDGGGPLEPLLEVVYREGLTVIALLAAHTHPGHVAGDAEL